MDKVCNGKSKYKDKELVPDWAAKEVAWLEAEEVFSDIAAEDFQPENSNRAEAAVVVYNTLFKK